jgi:hypothetical protein
MPPARRSGGRPWQAICLRIASRIGSSTATGCSWWPPRRIGRIGSSFVVEDDRFTWFFDAAGVVTIKLDEALLHAHRLDDGFVVSTNKRVARLDARGHARWELPAMKDTFVGAGGAVVLPGGDLLVYGYGAISDSGVELLRVRLDTGAVVFRLHSSGLNVDHSEYEHAAYVRLRGDHLDVVSIGSSGTFVDITDARTGKTIKRWQPPKR